MSFKEIAPKLQAIVSGDGMVPCAPLALDGLLGGRVPLSYYLNNQGVRLGEIAEILAANGYMAIRQDSRMIKDRPAPSVVRSLARVLVRGMIESHSGLGLKTMVNGVFHLASIVCVGDQSHPSLLLFDSHAGRAIRGISAREAVKRTQHTLRDPNGVAFYREEALAGEEGNFLAS